MEIDLKNKKYLAHYETPPREGHNVIRLTNHVDFCMTGLQLAWEQMCKEVNEFVWPERIILSRRIQIFTANLDCIETYKALDRIFGIIWHNADDVDEWWVTFNGTDKIFYSSGV